MISSGSGLLSGGAHRTAASDVRVMQRQAIVDVLRCRDAGEARAMQRRHQEVAGAARAVACEDTSRAVGAVCGWREPDEQQTRERVAEAGNGTTPVRVVAIRSRLSRAICLAVRHAGAGSARMTTIAS